VSLGGALKAEKEGQKEPRMEKKKPERSLETPLVASAQRQKKRDERDILLDWPTDRPAAFAFVLFPPPFRSFFFLSPSHIKRGDGWMKRKGARGLDVCLPAGVSAESSNCLPNGSMT